MDLRIGNLKLEGNLLLAPIAGYTDLAFRLVVRGCGGVSLAFTDLVSAQGLLRGTPGSLELVRTCPADSPLGLQLYGGEAEVLARAARLAQDRGLPLVDLNLGCPVYKVTRHGGGAALLRDPTAAVRAADALVRAVDIPVTVKMRLGWDGDTIVAPRLAVELERVGVAAVTVHARTAVQKLGGKARLDEIARVVDAVREIPVIGNGDVRSPADAARMMARTGCAGVMIGRAALGDPWIFRDTRALLAGNPPSPAPTREQRIDLVARHFRLLLEHVGEARACQSIRRRIRWHAKTLHPARRLRAALQRQGSAAEFERAIAAFRISDRKVEIDGEPVGVPVQAT
ncbi:MAG: tRNA dihydrouridine synthase DusB [Phycisphaerales bacterium]|nr:MAG: tRNA dihydrouridine synthase DusB [Phycisphaerales bacterium]